MVKILVPTAGQFTVTETADYSIQVAKAIDAEVLALHVVRPGHSREAGELAIEYFETAGVQHEVPVECHIRSGLIVDQIIDFAEEHSVDLIVMGASQGTIVDKWISSDVRNSTMIPVLIIPYEMFDEE